MSLTCKCYVGTFSWKFKTKKHKNHSLMQTGRCLGSEAGLSQRPQGHTLSWCPASLSTLLRQPPYWLASSQLQLAQGPVASPGGQNSPEPFSCRVHCQQTQSLEFQHSNSYERNIRTASTWQYQTACTCWLLWGQISNPAQVNCGQERATVVWSTEAWVKGAAGRPHCVV